MGTVAAVVAVLALAALLSVGVGLGESLAQSSSGPTSPSFYQDDGAAVERIAVGLAPGVRLVKQADGSLSVVRGGLAAPVGGSSDVPVRLSGELAALGISVLEIPGTKGLPAAGGTDGASPGTMADGAVEASELVQTLRLMPGVLWAEESHPVYACIVPDDPLYPSGASGGGQWSLPHVGLPAAWDETTGATDVIVAIVDSGINADLPDFAGRIVSPYNVILGTDLWPAWKDNYGHGSAVAGVAVAAGNNGYGMAGVAWGVKIMPVKIANSNESDDVTLSNGIRYAVDHGADVINVSFAGAQWSYTQSQAVNYALAHDVVIVGATGNNYSSTVYYPAAIPGVIAVGASDRYDARASFSNYGSELDLLAPGTNIVSATKDTSQWAVWSGTSFASPLVAGVVALMRSADPALSVGELTDMLNYSADDLGSAGWDYQTGWGLVDAEEAVSQAAAGGTTSTTEPPTTSSTTTSTTTTTTTITTTSTTTTTSSTTSTTSTTAPSTTTTTAPRFVDVDDETPYADQIEQLAAMGVVSGTGDGYFHPLEALKRQQFAKMIVLVLGYPVSEQDLAPFTDVLHIPGDLYPYHYVAVAYAEGITEGTAPYRFSPYSPITRAQMITMVSRAAGLPEPPTDYVPPFSNFSTVHYPYARKAAAAGLLDSLLGIGPDYDFFASATRAEVCALLYGLLEQ